MHRRKQFDATYHLLVFLW